MSGLMMRRNGNGGVNLRRRRRSDVRASQRMRNDIKSGRCRGVRNVIASDASDASFSGDSLTPTSSSSSSSSSQNDDESCSAQRLSNTSFSLLKQRTNILVGHGTRGENALRLVDYPIHSRSKEIVANGEFGTNGERLTNRMEGYAENDLPLYFNLFGKESIWSSKMSTRQFDREIDTNNSNDTERSSGKFIGICSSVGFARDDAELINIVETAKGLSNFPSTDKSELNDVSSNITTAAAVLLPFQFERRELIATATLTSLLNIADILLEIPQAALLETDLKQANLTSAAATSAPAVAINSRIQDVIDVSDGAAVGGLTALAAMMMRFEDKDRNCSFRIEEDASVWPVEKSPRELLGLNSGKGCVLAASDSFTSTSLSRSIEVSLSSPFIASRLESGGGTKVFCLLCRDDGKVFSEDEVFEASNALRQVAVSFTTHLVVMETQIQEEPDVEKSKSSRNETSIACQFTSFTFAVRNWKSDDTDEQERIEKSPGGFSGENLKHDNEKVSLNESDKEEAIVSPVYVYKRVNDGIGGLSRWFNGLFIKSDVVRSQFKARGSPEIYERVKKMLENPI